MSDNTFSIQFRSATYDVGLNGQMSLTALLRYFQEAAHEHANNLGVGFSKLREQNIFWVLSAINLEIGELPGFDEIFTIKTWPRGNDRLYSLRDFLLFHNDKIVAKATTLWLLIDVNSKRPIRPERVVEGIDFFSEKRVFSNDFAPITPIIEKSLIEERHVRFSDLDINRHVNNVRYLEWVLDAVHDYCNIENRIKGITVQYLGEFLEGEKAFIYSEPENETKDIKVEINHQDGKTGIRALVNLG